jgi:hypothetical protein
MLPNWELKMENDGNLCFAQMLSVPLDPVGPRPASGMAIAENNRS